MSRFHRTVPLLLAAALATTFAFAQPPEHAGKGGQGKGQQKQQGKERDADPGSSGAKGSSEAGKGSNMGRAELKPGAYFNDKHRDSVRTYYAQNHGGKKNCPPGLAKKNNGCMPPGQAKKWNVGQPLPRDVVVYTVPRQVLVTLPPQPPGYKYVRVASDILLIAIGTQMVVDGITDLMQR